MGWVWKQDQAWRGAYRDEAGKQHTKSFKRQIDAKRWVATEEAKVVRGDWVNPAAGKVTFAAFYADWSPRQVWLSSTRENADLAVAGVTFGDMPLRSIRRSHVEAWVKQMSASLAPTTIDTRFTIVRGVFRAAVADRLIPSDPTIGVVLPRKRKAEAAMSIPTNADVALLLNAAEPPNRPKSRPGFTAFVALCAFAGLRRGEALGVQVGDIDFLARTLRVKRQIQRAKAADIAAGKDLVEAVAGITVMVRPPKYESERTIYLPDEVIDDPRPSTSASHTPTGEPTRWLFYEGGKPWHDNPTGKPVTLFERTHLLPSETYGQTPLRRKPGRSPPAWHAPNARHPDLAIVVSDQSYPQLGHQGVFSPARVGVGPPAALARRNADFARPTLVLFHRPPLEPRHRGQREHDQDGDRQEPAGVAGGAADGAGDGADQRAGSRTRRARRARRPSRRRRRPPGARSAAGA